MPWVVAHFVETDEVEVLPQKWLMQGGNALYPPHGRVKLEKAIKNEEEPQECYKSYKVNLMINKSYPTFLKASLKANKACVTSDITDSECELPTKRMRKRRTLSSSSSSGESEISLEFLTKPPEVEQMTIGRNLQLELTKPKVSKKLECTSSKGQNFRNKVLSTPEVSTFKDSVVIGDKQSDSSACHRMSVVGGKISKYMDSFAKEVIGYSVKHKRILEDHEQNLQDMKIKLDQHTEMLGKILNHLEGKKIPDPEFDISQIESQFPIKDQTGFEQVEALLENAELKKAVIVQMSRVGGRNYKEMVRRICEKIMENKYMLGYSMVGHKGKKSFKSSILFSIIVDAILLTDQRVTAKEIEINVGFYFAKAKERITRQNQKIPNNDV